MGNQKDYPMTNPNGEIDVQGSDGDELNAYTDCLDTIERKDT